MSVRIMNMVFERYPTGGGEMLLALALADHANDEGERIYPKIAGLATKTRQSERSVQYQLRRMEDAGWLELVNDGDGGRGQHRHYRISPTWVNGAISAPLLSTGEAPELSTKGAEIAPIRQAKRVQSTTEKGAIHDRKGCKAFAPTNNRIESSLNHQGSALARAAASPGDAATLELPEGLSRETWLEWLSDRAERGRPVSVRAAGKQFAALERFRAEGFGPNEVIDHAIASGNQGIYRPPRKPSQQPQATVDMARWWTSDVGREAKARELGVQRGQGPRETGSFEARLWVAAGDGPWWDQSQFTTYALATRLRAGAEERRA